MPVESPFGGGDDRDRDVDDDHDQEDEDQEDVVKRAGENTAWRKFASRRRTSLFRECNFPGFPASSFPDVFTAASNGRLAER